MYGDKPSMGWRDVLDVIEEEKEVTKIIGDEEIKTKQTWKYLKLGGYQYVSYSEVRERAHDLGKALLELGVEKGAVWNIYAATRCVGAIDLGICVLILEQSHMAMDAACLRCCIRYDRYSVRYDGRDWPNPFPQRTRMHRDIH
jgi:hypothetical protein